MPRSSEEVSQNALLRKIEEELQEWRSKKRQALDQGEPQDYASYRFLVGELRSINKTLEFISNLRSQYDIKSDLIVDYSPPSGAVYREVL